MIPPIAPARRGGQAVELLVTVAVLALLAAWILPQITGGSDEPTAAPIPAADTTKDQSNARTIVSLAQSVTTLGGKLPETKEEILDLLVAGTNVPFAGGTTRFQLTGMSPEQITAAARFLDVETSGSPRLIFRPAEFE
jgi:type II secretory pathway pseudopilin PulG